MKGMVNDFDFTSKVDMVKANVTDSIINKGELDNSFGNSGDEIKVTKKGEDIISKLETLIYGKQLVKLDIESRIRDLKQIIVAPLTQDIDEYCYRGYKPQITQMCDCLFLVYPYSVTCFRDDMNSNYVPSGSSASKDFVVDKQTAEMCSKYNDLVYRCIDICSEICLANTMLNNLDPNTKYLLNVQQLKSLGF